MRAALTAMVMMLALFAAPRAHAFIFDREEDYGRVVQSVNLVLADQIFSMPHPSAIDEDPAAARAALAQWAQGAAIALDAQLRRGTELRDPPRSRNRARRAAMRVQADSMSHFMIAFGLMLNEVDHFAAADPRVLAAQQAWYADAFYDARTLALRIQKDLAFAQSTLSDNALAAASLLVLAHSTDIQLELSRAAHNRAHGARVNGLDMAARLENAAQAMIVALAQARAQLPNGGDNAIVWQDCLDHEARIADAAVSLARDVRGEGDSGYSGAGAAMDRLLALYRDRPSRTISFAMTFTL